MGLTIHYTITPRQPVDATEARRLIFAACAATRRRVRSRAATSYSTRLIEPEDFEILVAVPTPATGEKAV